MCYHLAPHKKDFIFLTLQARMSGFLTLSSTRLHNLIMDVVPNAEAIYVAVVRVVVLQATIFVLHVHAPAILSYCKHRLISPFVMQHKTVLHNLQ